MTNAVQKMPPQTLSTSPAVEAGSAALMRLIETAATSPTFDVEKLQKLLDVKTQWEALEARKAFVAALIAFKADPPRVEKNKHVSFAGKGGGGTEYDHATLDHVCDVVGAALAQQGLSHTWETKQHENAMVEVTCVLTHVLGHSERTTLKAMPDDSGSKNRIQAIGSAVTYLQRYTLLAATGLAAANEDDDGHKADMEPISAEQKEELIALMKESGADVAKFLQYMNVPSLDELPAAQFEKARAALAKKRAAK